MAHPLILASGSLARKTLLANAGLDVAVVPASIDERQVEAGLPLDDRSPEGIALHLAIAKAKAVSADHPDALVIGCDQTLSLDKTILHKAASLDAAREILRLLNGKVHRLNSAVCLVQSGDVVWQHVGIATMQVRRFSESFMESYLDRNCPAILSSVGCYQLEGEGVQLFEAIEGDYFTVLGLPLLPLLAALRKLGVNHE